MGINWEDKEVDVIMSITEEYTYGGHSYKKEYTYEITGLCSFITFNKYYNGYSAKLYSKNQRTISYTLSKTEYKDGEETTKNTTTNAVNGTKLVYASANTSNIESNNPTGNSTYEHFDYILSNIENKWINEFGSATTACYYGYVGMNNAVDSNAYKLYSGQTSSYTNMKFSITVLDLSENVPIYLENDYGNTEIFSAYGNHFDLASTLVPLTYDGDGKTIRVCASDRHYVLMNLLDNYSKWNDGTQEKEYERRLDIYVNMDGTKKPNTNIHWKAKGRYGDDTDFSHYNFDIYSMGSGGENKILLGSFPLDSTEIITFTNKEMLAGRTHSGNYLQIAFNTNWLSADWWVATIHDNVNDFSEDYNKLSSPNNVPELHITINDRSGGDDQYKDDGDGDNEDDGDGGKDDDSGGSGGSGVNPHSLLTTTYILTPGRIQQIGSVLWESTFMENILLINNAPIENILSVKMFPFVFPSGTDTQIKIGNVSMGVNGQLLANSYNYRHDIGSVSIPKHYNSFLDFAPYTRLMIYLPYYGVTELDCSVYMGRTLSVSYIIDVVVGSCLINVYANGILTNQFSSQVGVDIPITSSNRAQVESAIVTNGLKSLVSADVGGMVNTLIDGGMAKYHTQTSGSPSSACGMYAYKNPMVIIDRPSYAEITGYAHSVGRTCLQQKQIKNVRGFTVMSEHIDLTGIPATNTELDEIKNILTNGFYA